MFIGASSAGGSAREFARHPRRQIQQDFAV
jgi:hypothetical protein